MKKKKLTKRQQIEEWVAEDSLIVTDNLEDVLYEIFETTMNYKKNILIYL